jgi:hypothetical protein
MDKNPPQKKGQRAASRQTTEALITCQPFTSNVSRHASDGVMRNFSGNGFYIETSRPYSPETILLMRTVSYPQVSPLSTDERPRSICLAEVKWMHTLVRENAIRFGMGARYLE